MELNLKTSSPSQAIVIKNPDGSTGQITVTPDGLKCDVVLEAQNVTIGNIHLQDAVNAAYILKIDTNGKIGISSLPTGTAVTANSTPMTLASDDPIAVAIKNAVANILPKGQATMANSAPVVLASDQSVIPVSAIQLPAALASDGSEKVSDTCLNWKPSVPISNAGAPYTSTASYASAISGPVNITRPYSTMTIHVKENNTNAITYQILGYLETSTYARPIVIATGIAVAKNADDYEIVTMALTAIDIQVMDTVGGTHGSAIVDVAMV